MKSLKIGYIVTDYFGGNIKVKLFVMNKCFSYFLSIYNIPLFIDFNLNASLFVGTSVGGECLKVLTGQNYIVVTIIAIYTILYISHGTH
jgi:hypothetical protein